MNRLLLSIVLLVFSISSMTAQDDVNDIFGSYSGKMTSSLSTIKEVTFQLSEDASNRPQLILKNYKIGIYTLEDITLDNIIITKDGEKWMIEGAKIYQGSYSTADGHYVMQLSIRLNSGKNYVSSGVLVAEMDVTFSESTIHEKFTSASSTTGIKLDAVNRKGEKDVIYDLHGRRVTNPKHGVYIVNSRKVVL